MGMESRFTWMNGGLIPTEQAVVPFLTSGLHYGLGVFEGIRCYDTSRGPAIFRLHDHVVRFVESAKVLALELPYTTDDLVRACVDTVAANGFTSCYLRPLAYSTTTGWNLSLRGTPVNVGVAAWEWKAYLGEHALAQGIRANVSSYTRHHPNVSMTKGKITGNYTNSTLAKTESLRLGFDEAIMLDPFGNVAECTGANLFIVRRGRVITPPRSTILEGITRDAVMTIARDLGYTVEEEMLSRDQLYIAEEIFVTGTAAEVIGIREIDARVIGAGVCGPVTRHLQTAFQDAVMGRTASYQAWLHPVELASAAAPRC